MLWRIVRYAKKPYRFRLMASIGSCVKRGLDSALKPSSRMRTLLGGNQSCTKCRILSASAEVACNVWMSTTTSSLCVITTHAHYGSMHVLITRQFPLPTTMFSEGPCPFPHQNSSRNILQFFARPCQLCPTLQTLPNNANPAPCIKGQRGEGTPEPCNYCRWTPTLCDA